jgi:hypothetical protein
MRLGIDATREATDDDDPGGGKLSPQRSRDVSSVARACTGAHDRDARAVQKFW